MSEKIYFSDTLANDMMSYNKRYNMIVSNRSYGKTYWVLKRAIRNYLKKGEEFIYLRRNMVEIDSDKISNLFSKVSTDKEFRNTVILRVVGKRCQISRDIDPEIEESERNWITFGYIMALTQASNFKSIDYPKVSMIVFEEFLIEEYGGRRYLPNEPKKLKDLYVTVARERTTVKVYMLANSLSMNNPYFNYWKIYPYSEKIEFYTKGDVLLCYPNESASAHQEFMLDLYDSDGTDEYSQYAFKNGWANDNRHFIEKKSDTAKYDFTIIYNDDKIGVWYDYVYGTMYISHKVDPSCPFLYSFTKRDHSPNLMLVTNYNKFPKIKKMKECFELGCLRFENAQIKSLMSECLRWL